MAQANGSHKWLDRNQSAHEDPSSSSSSSSFESPITPTEWENDEVRTQSKSDGETEDILQDDKCCLSELGVGGDAV